MGRASVALLLVVIMAAVVSPAPRDVQEEGGKLPDEKLLLDALASAVKERASRAHELRLLDMSTSPPGELHSGVVTPCARASSPIKFSTGDGAGAAGEGVTFEPFILSEDGKSVEGLDAMDDRAKLKALFLLALCEPYPVKTINKLNVMTLDPARRQLLTEDKSRPSQGFFYRLDDPEAGSGMEVDFEVERVLRLVTRARSDAKPLEVVIQSETITERGDPPRPVSVWRYALRRGKKVLWIVEVS